MLGDALASVAFDTQRRNSGQRRILDFTVVELETSDLTTLQKIDAIDLVSLLC